MVAIGAANSLSVLRLNPLRDIISCDLSHVGKTIIKGSFSPNQLNISKLGMACKCSDRKEKPRLKPRLSTLLCLES